jgi:hypothetical protein
VHMYSPLYRTLSKRILMRRNSRPSLSPPHLTLLSNATYTRINTYIYIHQCINIFVHEHIHKHVHP